MHLTNNIQSGKASLPDPQNRIICAAGLNTMIAVSIKTRTRWHAFAELGHYLTQTGNNLRIHCDLSKTRNSAEKYSAVILVQVSSEIPTVEPRPLGHRCWNILMFLGYLPAVDKHTNKGELL